MNRKLASLALSGALLCSMGTPSLAADASRASEQTETKQDQTLPASQLYYGEVKAVLTGADGTVTGLYMDSDRSGEYVMKIFVKYFVRTVKTL